MKIAAVLIRDRHSDPEIHLFAKQSVAIKWAKAKAREYDRFGDLDEELTTAMKRDGWLYYGRYSVEGDHIRVELLQVTE